jgi:hypothetical protein
MTMNELLEIAPKILDQLMREFIRSGDREYQKDPKSQASACFGLAIRSTSLLVGMAKVLSPQTRDSLEVLIRGFLEARDLLTTFRFDDKGTRDKIGYWFEGKLGNSWKADHAKCEQFFTKLGHPGSQFATRWSMMTTLAHPTRFATENSAHCASLWAMQPPRTYDFATAMTPKIADYLISIATIIDVGTYDLPGLISLGCDHARMPHVEAFRQEVFNFVVPILDTWKNDLPLGSYRA